MGSLVAIERLSQGCSTGSERKVSWQQARQLRLICSRHHAGLTEGLKVASERLSWGFSRGAKALAGNRHAADSLTAKAKRALRAAPQVHACPRLP